MARKKKKYRPVYKKGYTPKTKKSKLIEKLDSAAKKYDKFLEGTREKGSYVKGQIVEGGQIVGQEFKKTGEALEEVRKPVAGFFQKAGKGIKEGFTPKPISGDMGLEQPVPPQPFESKDIWGGRRTRRGRLPRLFRF